MWGIFYIYFFILCATYPLGAQVGFQLLGDKTRSRIPFELVNNLPVLKVNINGSDFSFILDTGVKSTILFSDEFTNDFQIKNTIPVQMQGLGPEGSISAIKSKNNIIKVGKVVDENHELYIIYDKALNFSPRMGVPINGILGNEFFRNFLIKINYSSKTIIVYDPKKYSLRDCKKCENLPLNFVGGKPYINLVVSNGISNNEVTLLVDSGSSDALWLFDEENYISDSPKNYFKDFLGLGLGGNIYGKRGRVHELIIGDFHLENIGASFPEETAIAKARLFENRDGSVGGGFLSRFNLIFDYGNKTVQFKKNNRFKEPFNYNMSGLTLEHSGMDWLIDGHQFTLVPRYIAVDVRDNSPAHLAGVERNDEILAINGKANYSYKLYELIDLFSSDQGKKITLEIKRGLEFKRIRFLLKNVF